jgi:phosphatidylinositol alpha-1,6-mannosyltransferase
VTGVAPLRILALVTDAFGSHGGIAQYNRDFLSVLAAIDCVGEMIVLPRNGTSTNLLPIGVHQLPPVKHKMSYSFKAISIALRQKPIDLVFCGHISMLPLASVIAKSVRAKVWVQVHGIEAWQELSRLHQRALAHVTLVTSVSRYTRRRLLQWSSLDPNLVKIVPNTVDRRFRPGPKPRHLVERFAAGHKKILMTISRLASSERYKGHDRVIRILPQILASHPETLYLIVGDGDDRPRLMALVEELGLAKSVQFVSSVGSEILPEFFRLADVFVMPSTGEGFGIVFLEAMASGIVVIGGNQDGSLDPLGDGMLGLAVDPENPDQLASAIGAALTNPAANPEHANRFNAAAFRDHIQSLVMSNFVRSVKRSRTVPEFGA